MSCCRDAYRQAQRAYDARLPEDPEEEELKEAQKRAREERRIDDLDWEK